MCFEYDGICDKCLNCSAYASNFARGEFGDCMGSVDASECTSYESMAEVCRRGESLMDYWDGM